MMQTKNEIRMTNTTKAKIAENVPTIMLSEAGIPFEVLLCEGIHKTVWKFDHVIFSARRLLDLQMVHCGSAGIVGHQQV